MPRSSKEVRHDLGELAGKKRKNEDMFLVTIFLRKHDEDASILAARLNSWRNGRTGRGNVGQGTDRGRQTTWTKRLAAAGKLSASEGQDGQRSSKKKILIRGSRKEMKETTTKKMKRETMKKMWKKIMMMRMKLSFSSPSEDAWKTIFFLFPAVESEF